jgi:hypothetical protein
LRVSEASLVVADVENRDEIDLDFEELERGEDERRQVEPAR